MRIYVDEDSVHDLLVRLLRSAGHDVETPSIAGLIGCSDAVQLHYSISTNRPLLTANHRDFRELHNLIMKAGGSHPGILIARRDNDRRRDHTPRVIVTAIGNLLAANVPVRNELIVLNQWRYEVDPIGCPANGVHLSGSWGESSVGLLASVRTDVNATDEYNFVGFRVARVPTAEDFGDYNHDGFIDAADFVVWRKNDGTPGGFQNWRESLGVTLPGLSSGNGFTLSNVPEPTTSLLFALAPLLLNLVFSRETIARSERGRTGRE